MKKLILFLFLAVGCYGQNTGQNVVNVTVLPATTYTTNTVITSAPIQNIGQTNHSVRARVSAITGTVAYSGKIQGSVDCTNYFNIGPVYTNGTSLLGLTNGTILPLTGYGSYACIRVVAEIILFGAGSVTLTEGYSGNSSAAFTNTDQYLGNNGIIVNAFEPLTFTTGVPIISPSLLSGTIVLYGMTVGLPSTLTLLSVYCSSDGMNVDNYLLLLSNSIAQTLTWPSSTRSYGFCSSPADTLYYQAIGSGTASLTIQYRYE